jgi:hypothetical protein
MVQLECYEAKLKDIIAVQDADIIPLNAIPVEMFIQDTEMLLQWVETDKEAFLKANFNWKIVEDIPILILALREAGSRWMSQRFAKKETGKLWKEKSVELYNLRNSLLHEFRYAYRKNFFTLNRVNAIAGRMAYASLIQDLSDLSVLGKENPNDLKSINFDIPQLEKASLLAHETSVLFAASTIEGDCSAAKKIRDQAFTLLKNAVDEVCDCGQYIFWKDETRRKGYSSAYLRRIRKKKEKEETKPTNEQTQDPDKDEK